MTKNSENKIYSKEYIGAILIIAFVSMFILANFFIGFSLPVYALAIIPAILISFLHPKSGFFAIVFLTFIFERFFTLAPIVMGRSEYKIYPIDFLMGAVLLGILFSFLNGTLKIKFKKIDFFLALFIFLAFLYGAVSIFILNNESALSFSSAKNYGFYALLYFITSILIRSRRDFIQLVKFLVTGGIIIIGFLIYGILSGEGLWSQYTPLSTEGIRILAFTHGYYLSMLSVFAFSYIFYKSKNSEFSNSLAILFPIWIIGIIGSMMRHLWISIFGALLVIIFILGKDFIKSSRKILIKYVMIFIFAIVSITYFSLIFPSSELSENVSGTVSVVGKRFSSIGNSADESIFWRNIAWNEALKKYSQNPIFGTGFGEYVSVEIGDYREFVEVRNIHNSFLVLLVQMGALGILVFATPILMLVKNIFKKLKTKDDLHIARVAVLGVLVLHAIAFIFQPYLETNLLGIFFWINLGLMRSLSDYKNSINYKYEDIRNK